MAVIRNLQTNKQVILMANHIIGRHPITSHLVLSNPKASRIHANIGWDGAKWILQDNSSNGTFVNNKRMKSKSSCQLQVNDKLSFVNTDENVWQVEDLSPPSFMLLPESENSEPIILEDLTVLPNEDSPQLTVYRSSENQWFCESSDGIWQLSDGARLQVDEQVWRFVEGTACDETIKNVERIAIKLNQISAKFNVSQNEEHVFLDIHIDDHCYKLGENNHHYLILLLARQYIEDTELNRDKAECGWIGKDLVANMLNQIEVNINMQIYRFRKKLAQIMPENLALPQLIERRHGEIRFNCEQIDIIGGFEQKTE